MRKTKTRHKAPTFLQKTYNMVDNPANVECVGWSADGLGFIIINIADFTERVLPRYFKHRNFASFVRQLNLYDFHKSREAGSETVFRHPLFMKGHKSLLQTIKRKNRDVIGSTQLSSHDCHLIDTMKTLQHEHESLQQTLQELRGENRDMAQYNQHLMSQLATYKAREARLEELLLALSNQISTAQSTQCSDLRDSSDRSRWGEGDTEFEQLIAASDLGRNT